MLFDATKLNQELEPRTAEVICNELASLYREPAKEDIVFKVKGLSGNDLVAISEVRNAGAFVQMLSDALIANKSKDGAEAIMGLLGIFNDSLHPDLKYRVELVVRGSVEPKIDYSFAVKLARHFYVAFHRISEKVLELSGQGAQLKKKPSTG